MICKTCEYKVPGEIPGESMGNEDLRGEYENWTA